MSKVLVLATYPIKNPQHGGQKRLEAVVSMYKNLFPSVKFVSIFYKKIYKEYSRDDISLGFSSSTKAEQNPLTGDIICGQAIYNDAKVKKAMVGMIKSYAPDVIHIEQPYIYLGLKPLLKELGLRPKLVFGSQNIEGPMKREILEGAGVKVAEIDAAVRIINNVETQLSQECDLLTACTEDDLKKHQAMGAANVVLSQNGIAPAVASKTDLKQWRTIFKSEKINNKVLFVASAHPPSITGFIDMIGKGLGFLPKDTRLLMAGSICDYFEHQIKTSNIDIEDATFWLRAYPCGRLSEGSLSALIKLTDIIVLPITEGGGSNLKTAEAILADKKIVTTSHALRSFEWLSDFPNVWTADTPVAFKAAISEAMQTPFVARTPAQQKQAKTVLWSSRLKDFEKRVSTL